jgi:FixJ family two-component response regulator
MVCDLMNQKNNNEMDVLVLAPYGKDAALIGNVLRQSKLEVRIAQSPGEVVAAVPGSAGTAIIAEEALKLAAINELGQKLQQQPAWSDFPVLVLTGGGLSTAATEIAVRARAPLGNVTLLERPLRPATLISAVRSALAARRRQYEIRNHLCERQMAEEALRGARDALGSIVEERTLALRRLSARLIRLQDDERRRFARELHDSLGQYLAAAKITLDMVILNKSNGAEGLAEAQELIDRAISETRTLSHLLHPPLLDTAGFASAATWYDIIRNTGKPQPAVGECGDRAVPHHAGSIDQRSPPFRKLCRGSQANVGEWNSQPHRKRFWAWHAQGRPRSVL